MRLCKLLILPQPQHTGAAQQQNPESGRSAAKPHSAAPKMIPLSALEGEAPGHTGGYELLRGCAVAELTVVVPPPAVGLPRRCRTTGMMLSGPEGSKGEAPAHGGWLRNPVVPEHPLQPGFLSLFEQSQAA